MQTNRFQHRAVIILCTDHYDGLTYMTCHRDELPQAPTSYVSDPRQLQSRVIRSDVKVCRTDAFTASPGRQALEDTLLDRSELDVIRFLNADGVLYPVVKCGLQPNEDVDCCCSPRLHVATAWGGLTVLASVESFHIYAGRSTVFVEGLRLLEAE